MRISVILIPIGVAATLVLAVFAAQDLVYVNNGFLTGNEFRKMPLAEQRSYAMGYADGLFVSPLMGADKAKMKWIVTLIEGMSDEQIAAILLAQLQRNPEVCNEFMHTIAYRALREAYEKKYGRIETNEPTTRSNTTSGSATRPR